MKQTRNLSGLFAGIGLLLLIFDSRLALEGARNGLELCIRTVIPSLFPFIVMSMLLMNSFAGNSWIRPAANYLGIPPGGETILLPAILGGYPVGAKCIHDLYRTKQIEKKQAERMLAFCSNAGPAFLFGMLPGFFPEIKTVWLLWLVHVFSAFLTGSVIPTVEANENIQSGQLENSDGNDILLSAIKAMAQICAWIILFRILSTFLDNWFLWLFPQWLQVLITGMVELANGCLDLMMITDIKVRFLLSSCILAFGGVCVLLQTASVTKGLSLRYYLIGKGIQTVFSLALSCGVIWEHGWVMFVIVLIVITFIRNSQKKYRNPCIVPV